MSVDATTITELRIRELAVQAAIKVVRRMARVKTPEAKATALESESMRSILKAKKLGWRGDLDTWTRVVAWHAGQRQAKEAGSERDQRADGAP